MKKLMMAAVLAMMTMTGVAEAYVYIPKFPMPVPTPHCPFRPGCVPPRVPLPVPLPFDTIAQTQAPNRPPAVAAVRG